MVNQPTAEDRLIDRRSVLRTGLALAAAGPVLLQGAHSKAEPRPSSASPIIDAQVHAYAANTPERPWHSVPNWPPHVTGDEMVAASELLTLSECSPDHFRRNISNSMWSPRLKERILPTAWTAFNQSYFSDLVSKVGAVIK
jgi:hypothetical protein